MFITDAPRPICEQFTVMIDDTKMQDELLAKLSDTSVMYGSVGVRYSCNIIFFLLYVLSLPYNCA